MNTSHAAYESILPHVSRLARDVYRAIEAAGRRGMTCEECEIQLGMKHQTASARIRELKDERVRLVVDSGRRRATTSGRQAAVMVISAMAAQECDHGRSKWVETQYDSKRIRTTCRCGKFIGYRNA